MDLWKYCTPAHCREMLLSFRLLGENDWPDEKVTACLYALSNHAENHYDKVKIPKKSGGSRTLLVPDALLKQVQRNILHHILDGRPTAACASAYHRGASVASNAAPHVGRPVIMKLDIEDFFGSITVPMVLRHAFPGQYGPPAVGMLLTALCCCRECLPQGAPTSPAVSNLVMRPFDEYMERWCKEREIVYTRYCDDMTFSGDFDVSEVRRKVYGFLQAMGFTPNREKERILTQGSRQIVTGIVVNRKMQVPRDYRRKLRQELYYFRKFGAEEYLRRMEASDCRAVGPARPDVPDSQDASGSPARVGRYLEALLGKINFVLLVNPEDPWFREAGAEIKKELKRRNRAK